MKSEWEGNEKNGPNTNGDDGTDDVISLIPACNKTKPSSHNQ